MFSKSHCQPTHIRICATPHASHSTAAEEQLDDDDDHSYLTSGDEDQCVNGQEDVPRANVEVLIAHAHVATSAYEAREPAGGVL
jgi:hypothetical protein|eukprot:4485325-Prymnesium_polylepis.1